MNTEKSTDGLLHVCAAQTHYQPYDVSLLSYLFVAVEKQIKGMSFVLINKKETHFFIISDTVVPFRFSASPTVTFPGFGQSHARSLVSSHVAADWCVRVHVWASMNLSKNTWEEDLGEEWCPITIRSLLSSSDYFLTLHLWFISPAPLISHLWFSKISFLLFLQTMFFFSSGQIPSLTMDLSHSFCCFYL